MMTFNLPSGRIVKLGRIAPKVRPQALKFGDYLTETRGLSDTPLTLDYYTKASASLSRVYLNDQWGCCVISGKYHSIGVWSANSSGIATVGTDNEILQAYRIFSPNGDNGCVITEVLDWMKVHGFPFNGVIHKIDGYVSVDWRSIPQVKTALYLFGTLSIGINLPSSWQNSKVWDVTNSRIIGGHDVTCVGYTDKGVQISSWGELFTITWAAFTSTKWLDECYLPLAPSWYSNNNLAPNGIDVATLRADLNKISGGDIPPIIVPPPIDPPKPPIDPPKPPPIDPPKPPIVPPASLTLAQAIAAAQRGIEAGRPYPLMNAAVKAKQYAAWGLTTAWPKS